MVKPGDAGEGDDATGARRLDGPRDRRIAVKRHVGAVLVVVGPCDRTSRSRWRSPRTMTWSRTSRRSVPTNRSA
jgi:hypothetical protein